MKDNNIFISYSGHDEFEASLLKFAIEKSLGKGVTAWTFRTDQAPDQKGIAESIKNHVRNSAATIFLASPSTLESGATHWMELAYADAYNIPTYVLMHHLDYHRLRDAEKGVPPLILQSQCNAAVEWRRIIRDLKAKLKRRR